MLASLAHGKTLQGRIINSDDLSPVPYATVLVLKNGCGVLSDEKGNFIISIDNDVDSLAISAISFNSIRVSISDLKSGNSIIKLTPVGFVMKEVVVRPKKEKYSKKNNPAVDLSRRIAKNRKRFNPRNNSYYNYCQFHRYSLGLNDFDTEREKNILNRRFNFLKDYAETSQVTGKPILILSVREISSSHHYRNNPEKFVNIIKGQTQVGVDDFLDEENLRVFLDDILGDVDIYKNDVTLLQNRFVSPFSPIAPDFYRFYLTDTIEIDSITYVELSFVPRNPLSFGFTGKMYVEKDDPSTFIKRVTLNVPKDINLNFIDRIYITQAYQRMPDSSSVKTSENIIAEIQPFPAMPSFYAEKSAIYSGHDFNSPKKEDLIFNRLGNNVNLTTATGRDRMLVDSVFYTPLSDNVSRTNEMVAKLRANKFYYWSEKILKLAFTGYINTAKTSKIDIGPMNTLFSHNEVEGYRFRVGGMTTANLNSHLFGRTYIAWGTKDHKLKYMGELEYSFTTKHYHSREFPIHSIRATYKYDVDMLGQHFAFTNPDNIVLSFRRHKDYQMTYLRQGLLNYTLELPNNFSIEAGFKFQRQYSTDYMSFFDSYGNNHKHYNINSVRVQLRYAPGEKFYQTKTHRYPISLDAPVVSISHEFAPYHSMGNTLGVNKTELSFQKRFWLSSFGYIDGIVKGGHVWGRSYYPDLLIPNANLSYTIQPESYSLMNAMEFVNDSYASIDLTYWANGAIFNYIPLLKKLKLREVCSFKGLWGHLSSRNIPVINPALFAFPEICHVQKMTNRPYVEVSAGIENIFKVLRVDYVWRLTYLNNPGIDKHGVRVAMHITF